MGIKIDSLRYAYRQKSAGRTPMGSLKHDLGSIDYILSLAIDRIRLFYILYPPLETLVPPHRLDYDQDTRSR